MNEEGGAEVGGTASGEGTEKEGKDKLEAKNWRETISLELALRLRWHVCKICSCTYSTGKEDCVITLHLDTVLCVGLVDLLVAP